MASGMTAADVAHRDTISWIIKYHDRTNLGASARNLERNSGLFFNLKYFEDCFINGDLDEADYYLSGFTSLKENEFSTALFFEIRWHKFLQALDFKQRQRARKIVREELRAYECSHGFKEKVSALLAEKNFRNVLQTEYQDMEQARLRAVTDVIRYNLEANPSLKGKIVYPPQSQPLAVVIPPPRANQADQSQSPQPSETRGVTIQPLPAPQPPPQATSLQLFGVIRLEREEEMEHGNNSRHCLGLVPVNVHPENLGSTSEAPKRKLGRPDGRRNNSRMDSRAPVPDILGTTAENPKRKRGRPWQNNSNLNVNSRTGKSAATPR